MSSGRRAPPGGAIGNPFVRAYSAMAYPTPEQARERKRLKDQHQERFSHTRPVGASADTPLPTALPPTPIQLPPALPTLSTIQPLNCYADPPRPFHPPRAAPQPASCDACEKDFPNAARLRAHLRTHVQCSQCPFSASGRVVADHEADFHGIHKESSKPIPDWCRIRIESPEELAAWIEQRKRNYPTAANVERKQRDIQDRIVRGELLLPNGKRPRSAPRDPRIAKRPRPTSESQEGVPALDQNNGDEDDDAPPEVESSSRPQHHPNDSHGSPESDESIPFSRRESPICKYWRRGQCRHGSRCRFRHDNGCAPRSEQPLSKSTSTPRRKPLLANLLEHEMRLDHSRMLQCFRFIVNNRFFDNGLVWTPTDSDYNQRAAAAMTAKQMHAADDQEHSDDLEEDSSSAEESALTSNEEEHGEEDHTAESGPVSGLADDADAKVGKVDSGAGAATATSATTQDGPSPAAAFVPENTSSIAFMPESAAPSAPTSPPVVTWGTLFTNGQPTPSGPAADATTWASNVEGEIIFDDDD